MFQSYSEPKVGCFLETQCSLVKLLLLLNANIVYV